MACRCASIMQLLLLLAAAVHRSCGVPTMAGSMVGLFTHPCRPVERLTMDITQPLHTLTSTTLDKTWTSVLETPSAAMQG